MDLLYGGEDRVTAVDDALVVRVVAVEMGADLADRVVVGGIERVTGFEVEEQHPEKMEEGRRQLTRIIREAQTETDGHCRGVFYWEPQCLPGGYKLGAFDSKAAPTVIMDGFLE